MQLKPGMAAEYERRHAEIWPELAAALQAAGIRDYSIFLDEATNTLFAIQHRTADHTVDGLREHPVMRRWWDFMAPLMEVHADHAPVEWPLREVFHLD